MAATRQVVLTLAFADATDRNFKFNGVEDSAVPAMKGKILRINENMPESFKTTFVSDNGAQCIMISAAQVILTEEEVIYSAG